MSYNMEAANAYITKLEGKVKDLMIENDRIKLGVINQDYVRKIATLENMAKTTTHLHRQQIEQLKTNYETRLQAKEATIDALQKEIGKLRTKGAFQSKPVSSGLFSKKVNNPQDEQVSVNLTIKQLQKIMMAQHPDRITHTNDPELIANANELFQTLHTQYQELKK